MSGPFTTPVAFSTPFESEPDRINAFLSKNVQEAIEEALALAISNDRFLILAQYGGQANNGRVLEFFNDIDSEDAPLVFGNVVSNVIGIVCSTTSTGSNATIGFYNLDVDPGMNTPLYILSMNGLKSKQDVGTPVTPLFSLPAMALLAVKVNSSSIQKPHLQIVFSSAAS